jgi:methylaspartate mutase epsilon subunit
MSGRVGLGDYVRLAAARGDLVVQPRMGMANPVTMADGLRAVAGASAVTAATITLDSYTRVGDHAGARAALAGDELNGFPIVSHGPRVTALVTAAVPPGIPVQVRHGSARPGAIFTTMSAAGLSDSEGGPVSYCLPYGRTPLAESVDNWADATETFAASCAARGATAHLETFGGCLLGQLCPPSLLVAVSVLEAMFFAQHGITSLSLSYAQQVDPRQDIESLAALRHLARALLPAHVDWHVVVYTYMGKFPRTPQGARRILDRSVDVAIRGGAGRLIVKTVAEAHRIPTVAENIAALEAAARRAAWAREHAAVPALGQVDYTEVLAESTALVEAVLEESADIGAGLVSAFAKGLLDVPFCLHQDNRGLSQAAISSDGRLVWTRTGRMPLPTPAPLRSRQVSSAGLLRMLDFAVNRYDRESVPQQAGGRPVRARAALTAAAHWPGKDPRVPSTAGGVCS